MFQIQDILAIDSAVEFERYALELFRFQAKHCMPYQEYLTLIGAKINEINSIEKIPFLPIELFKTHEIYCSDQPAEQVFTSSNTGGTNPSRHFIKELRIYEKSFTACFKKFYGDPSKVSIYALLPNYLQRQGSSLIYMVDMLIAMNAQGKGGFYLDDHQALLDDMKNDKNPKILLGVSFALWDLADNYPCKLENTIVMETGGMKGKREELAKEEFHKILCSAFGVNSVHSEYGMAELTSQAYSKGKGVFKLPAWMKIMLRDLNNPFDYQGVKRGGINIIDLSNIYSCAFIQSQDIGTFEDEGMFKILGRADHSEIRGCNLLVARD